MMMMAATAVRGELKKVASSKNEASPVMTKKTNGLLATMTTMTMNLKVYLTDGIKN